ncbi:MAG: alpha/beta hydrolase, partial [Pseudomonadota bacterium]
QMILGLLLFSSQSFAFDEGVLSIASNHKVYYKYAKAETGKPTVVMLNGLIYPVSNWASYFNELEKAGFGVLQVAYSTHPESMRTLDEAPYFQVGYGAFYNAFLEYKLETQTLVDEVMAVVDSLKIKKFHLLTLSYSSIVGAPLAHQNQDRVEKLLLIAPAMKAGNRYVPGLETQHQGFEFSRMFNPVGTDATYDSVVYSLISPTVTPLSQKDKSVEFLPFFSGVYQMARSAKWFELFDYVDLDLPPTTLFLAEKEEEALLKDQIKFWDDLEKNPAKRDSVLFEGAFHALPGAYPKITAEKTIEWLEGGLPEGDSELKAVGKPGKDTTTSSAPWSSSSSK